MSLFDLLRETAQELLHQEQEVHHHYLQQVQYRGKINDFGRLVEKMSTTQLISQEEKNQILQVIGEVLKKYPLLVSKEESRDQKTKALGIVAAQERTIIIKEGLTKQSPTPSYLRNVFISHILPRAGYRSISEALAWVLCRLGTPELAIKWTIAWLKVIDNKQGADTLQRICQRLSDRIENGNW